jgi:hypothetical protein
MPRNPLTQSSDALLEHEFAQERASALGRLGRALEAALAALAEFDVAHKTDGLRALPREQRGVRADLVAQASVTLWQFAVQREACGLRDIGHVLRDYRVPPEVAARMGAMPANAARLLR